MLQHGGKREGSGRKKSASPFGEKTVPKRIPEGALEIVLRYLEDYKKNSKGAGHSSYENLYKADTESVLPIPIYSGIVAAGQSRFPSPAQDYTQQKLDLNKQLVKNPTATYYFTVGKSYDSMIDIGIHPGALLIVDRSIEAKSSHVVLAEVEGEFMVKRYYKNKKSDSVELRSENKEKNYPPITFKEDQDFQIWGVVTHNVNKL